MAGYAGKEETSCFPLSKLKRLVEWNINSILKEPSSVHIKFFRSQKDQDNNFVFIVPKLKVKPQAHADDSSSCKQETNDSDAQDELIVKRKAICDVNLWQDMSPFRVESILSHQVGDFTLKLHRPSVFALVLSSIQQCCNSYGHVSDSEAERAILLDVLSSTDDEGDDLHLGHLRAILLAQHIITLGSSQGYRIHCRQVLFKEDWKPILAKLQVNLPVFDQEHPGNARVTGHQLCASGGEMRSSCPDAYQILYLSPHGCSRHMEELDMAGKEASKELVLRTRQLHYGPVLLQQQNTQKKSLVQDYYRIRCEQMWEAARVKYGDDVMSGTGIGSTVEALTNADIRCELLGTSCKQQIRPELSESSSVQSRPGVFMLYNCARLTTLLQKYDDEVKKGVYPPLPDVASVDFSLLTRKEEWCLLCQYLMSYPDLLKDSVSDLKSASHKPNLHTHRVCQFLHGLSRETSVYYHHVHILGESLPHLLPLMFARLWLLKGIHQVMLNALGMLGIQPLDQF